ncbi:MAG: sulfatase-like hydrolase/transferase, partial [Candidatus Aureabacteria bacterium]|nr:sulfatase-like hydrolase/transferase [Candidatus Auribacterota bacterium]
PYLPSGPTRPLESFFKYTVFISHFLSLALGLVFILCLLYALVRSRVLAAVCSVLLFSLAQVYLFIDVRVYIHFRFHLSGIVFQAMATPGYWDSMHFEGQDRLFSILGAAGLILAELVLFLFLARTPARAGRFWRLTRPRILFSLAGLILLLSVVEKIGYGLADGYNLAEITRYGRIFPFYFPITFREWFDAHFGKKEIPSPALTVRGKNELAYPLPGFSYGIFPRRRNIVVILVEGLRSDLLNEEVMPNLNAFARRAIVCRNHYSAGNTSRFGAFGLFYGLYGSYWLEALNRRQGPVLIEALKRNGYLFKIMSSTSLSYPELSRTAFADVPDPLEDELPGEDSCERDDLLVENYCDWLATVPRDRPFFTFIFLDSSHSTFFFKSAFEKFTPCAPGISFVRTDLQEDREAIFNRYRNAVHYDDYNVGRIIQALEADGILDRTIVLITGDHGEEFWENGYFGHNSAYTAQQVKVPLVYFNPDAPAREIEAMTSHLDVPATILKALGDGNDPGLYGLGADVLGPARPAFLVLSGWDDCCLVTGRIKIRFSTESYNVFSRGSVTDLADRPIEDPALIRAEKDAYLVPVLEGMSRFLK